MSVVIGTSEKPRYRIECSDGRERDARIWATPEEAEQAMGEHYATCTGVLCTEWRSAGLTPVRTSPTLEVNSRNGAMLLDALGFITPEQQSTGECDAADFLGRVLLALAITPIDAGRPGTVLRVGWTDCGRRPGYLHEQLHRLHEIAEWAVLHGELIVWA